MIIQSDTFRTITQALHVIGAPTIVNVGVCGTSLVCIAEQDNGLTLYMSAEQGIAQDCQVIGMYSRQMRVIANHAPGILTVDNNIVRTADGAMRWNLFLVVPPDSLAVPPEIADPFQVGSRQQFLAALSSVVNSGSGDAIVQNEGQNWTIVCPKAIAWSSIRPAIPPPVTGISFLIRQHWSSAIIQMLHVVGSRNGELIFSITDGVVIIGWYDFDRSVMISIAIPHEQADAASVPDNMNLLGTVDGADFHRAISAIEAASAPDEAATLTIARRLRILTAMLYLEMPIDTKGVTPPFDIFRINTSPTRWMTQGTVDLWETDERLYVVGQHLTASWRKL